MPRCLVLFPFLHCLCKMWDFLFLFSGLENASLLLESRISRKPSVGVGVRSSQESKPAAWGWIRVSQAVKDKADKVLNFC